MIRLWIKGSIDDAKKAAGMRGIELLNAQESQRQTVMADATEEHLVKVIHWYCEDTEMIPGEGSPAGTLLLHC